jgi:hypothetical protein
LDPRKINQVSIVLLMVGWGSALVIYLTQAPPRFDPLVGNLLENKKYLHDLRVMGGKTAIANAELTAWFEDLWRGRNLAGTLVVLTIGTTLAFRFVAARPDLYGAAPASTTSRP